MRRRCWRIQFPFDVAGHSLILLLFIHLLFVFPVGSAIATARFGTFPRQFECFSCMSASYENNWKHLQLMYTVPKVYTDQCNQPLLQRNMATVLCGSMCITLLEPDVEAGVFLGYKYIRGCEDRILRHGFNHTALKTHRFMQMDKQCKNLPRTSLFNQPRHVQLSVFGDVQFCTCFGDKCNGASAGSNRHLQFAPILLMCSIILTVGWSSFFTQFGITFATIQKSHNLY
ncbi:ly-6-related protein [Ditylenchus destructor]|nr:ly-6-related protein [Ditylenchus destructor]